jgi:DNA-binding response OmpR family regulator
MSSRPKVLVTDNNASFCLSIATALQEAGYEADVAFTGHECLAKMISFRPHCLVLEALLPDISGYAVCRRIRQSVPEQMVRILLMSTKDAPLDRSYGLRQGADRYLSKPFTTEALLQEVWQITPKVFHNAVLRPISFMPQPQSQSHALPELLDLIPRRITDQEAMRMSSPFVNTPMLKDEEARRLYSAIDGKKTVIELAIVTGLEPKEIFKLLRMLLSEKHIEVYDSAGQPVEDTLLLAAL